jgi:hypothetical protein
VQSVAVTSHGQGRPTAKSYKRKTSENFFSRQTDASADATYAPFSQPKRPGEGRFKRIFLELSEDRWPSSMEGFAVAV